MNQTKKILVVCGTGAATSTVVAGKVKDFCESQGFKVDITQGKVTEIKSYADSVDLVVSTARVDDECKVPVIHALNLLTGINEEKVYDAISDALKK